MQSHHWCDTMQHAILAHHDWVGDLGHVLPAPERARVVVVGEVVVVHHGFAANGHASR